MRTLKLRVLVRVEGWVEVRREVPDDFDAAKCDDNGTAEDALCVEMEREAHDRVCDVLDREVSRETRQQHVEVVP